MGKGVVLAEEIHGVALAIQKMKKVGAVVDLGYGKKDSKQTNGDRDVGDTLVDVLPLKNTKKENSKVTGRITGPAGWVVLPGCGEHQLQSFGQQLLSTEEVMLTGLVDQWKR